MISYNRLWETMEKRKISQYRLIKEFGLSSGQMSRLKKNTYVSTHTLETLCRILDCRIEDVMEVSFEDEEKEMITNVVDFGDSRVRDVMIPRVDMTVVDVDADYDSVLNIYMKVPYTRIPVYEGSKDHIIGLLHIKDLFFYRATHKDEDFKIRSIMREPLYVFEFQKTNDLLSTMKSTSNSAGSCPPTPATRCAICRRRRRTTPCCGSRPTQAGSRPTQAWTAAI